MKKIIYIVISILLVMNLFGCNRQKNSEQNNEKANEETQDEAKLDKKEAQKILNDYMISLILKDENKTKLLYSSNLKKNMQNYKTSAEPHVSGYKIENIEQKENKFEVKAIIFSIESNKPYFNADESKYTIIKENDSYVIDKIENSKYIEVLQQEKILFMKEEGDTKGIELIKTDEIPAFAVPQGATPDIKLNIGRDNFGVIALDPEMKKLAITTVGNFPALLVLDIKEKKAKPIDVFTDSSIRAVAFSPDGVYAAVELKNNKNISYLYFYNIQEVKRVQTNINDVINVDKYSIDTYYWISDSEIVLSIAPIADSKKYQGAYKLDLKNMSLAKL